MRGSERRYIGCQGCLAKTVVDFWQMVWEQNTRSIVMTTNVVERGKNKCTKYWPEDGDAQEYGQWTIRGLGETAKAEYVVRRFLLTRAGNPERREITQYHFISWPDHGVPSTPRSVLAFLLSIKAEQTRLRDSTPDMGPMVVHCSAGIGRTGTFIVIDILLDVIHLNGIDCDIDVQRTIQNVRAQRSGMIQTEAQYRFIYQAVLAHIDSVKTRLDVSQAELCCRSWQPLGSSAASSWLPARIRISMGRVALTPTRSPLTYRGCLARPAFASTPQTTAAGAIMSPDMYQNLADMALAGDTPPPAPPRRR